MALTVKQIAEREQVSQRQVQRYLSEGFKGHVLKAVRVGRSFQIAEADYKAWRVLCGFDVEEPEAQPEALAAPGAPGAPRPASASPGDAHPAYPPWPMAADPNGVPTNVPHPHSSTMPHPDACRDYYEAKARRMKEQLRGYPDEK